MSDISQAPPSSSSASTISKSPFAALIGGLVAGFASVVLLALILVVLWRTRKRPFATSQPQRFPSAQDKDLPALNLTESGDGKEEGAIRTSGTSSTECLPVPDEPRKHTSPI